MIHDVDESLRSLIRRDALDGTDVDVVLDAPTNDWAARRNAPTVDLYLYDIHEELNLRQNGRIDMRDDDDHIVARRRALRFFRLSYLVTAWTQRPEDEHRLLSSVLECFLHDDTLPMDALAGSLAGTEVPIEVSVARPPPQDRAISDIWSALGGQLKPSLDVVVLAPMPAGRTEAAAGLVREAPRFSFSAAADSTETKSRPVSPAAVDETVHGGEEREPGRSFRVYSIPPPS